MSSDGTRTEVCRTMTGALFNTQHIYQNISFLGRARKCDKVASEVGNRSIASKFFERSTPLRLIYLVSSLDYCQSRMVEMFAFDGLLYC